MTNYLRKSNFNPKVRRITFLSPLLCWTAMSPHWPKKEHNLTLTSKWIHWPSTETPSIAHLHPAWFKCPTGVSVICLESKLNWPEVVERSEKKYKTIFKALSAHFMAWMYLKMSEFGTATSVDDTFKLNKWTSRSLGDQQPNGHINRESYRFVICSIN